MLYLSQLLNKKIYYQNKPFGKIVDMAIFINKTIPPVSKIEILQGKTKITIPPHAIRIENGRIILTTNDAPHLPYDHKDFYLAEDLLDKQVIDIDGRRLVRVNDIVLKEDHELRVSGIDIGFDGILRRLGLGIIKTKEKILPWNLIEAFDYETGNITIKLKQNTLSKLHPADIADILEGAGTKERLGIVESLDAKQAARAIEEADEETQVSILENLTPGVLKDIISKMHVSELADVFHDFNPIKSQEIQQALGTDKLQSIKRLSSFSDNVAGGLMRENFVQKRGAVTVKELLRDLREDSFIPEVVIVTQENDVFYGTLRTKDLLRVDPLAILMDIVSDKKHISEHASFDEMVRLFAQYNLRVLPVLNQEKKPIGIVLIDDILTVINEENERDESI